MLDNFLAELRASPSPQSDHEAKIAHLLNLRSIRHCFYEHVNALVEWVVSCHVRKG